MQALGLDGVEFPRIHPARNGLPTQFTALLARSREMNARVDGFDSVLALHGEQQKRHGYGNGWIAEEHVYVPRSPSAREGQGWVLGTARPAIGPASAPHCRCLLRQQIRCGTVVQAQTIDNVQRDDAGKLSLNLRGGPDKLSVSRLYSQQFRAM